MLEVFADTDLDPWSFLLLTETFVGAAQRGRSHLTAGRMPERPAV